MSNDSQPAIQLKHAKDLSALRIGEGTVRYLEITDRVQLPYLHELRASGEKIHIIGKGTNSVFGTYSGIVVSLGFGGHQWLDDRTLQIAGGVDWQIAVDESVKKELVGIERLTLIPGTATAAPVQNIGAFNQLLSNVLIEIEVFDIASNTFLTIPTAECGFGGHRDSNFKSNYLWAEYIIISLTLKLSPMDTFAPPTGKGIEGYMSRHNLNPKTVAESEKAVRGFRGEMYPDYIKIPNTGSYFTNYEINKSDLSLHPREILDIVHRENSDGTRILFQCKDLLHSIGVDNGFDFGGGLKMHDEHNNFLTNPDGNASLQDLINCHSFVNNKLQERYGISLIPESDFIDDTRDRWVK